MRRNAGQNKVVNIGPVPASFPFHFQDLELQKSRNQELRAKIDDLMRQITMYRAVLVQHVPGIENLYPPK